MAARKVILPRRSNLRGGHSGANLWYAWLVLVMASLTSVKLGPIQITEAVLLFGLPLMLQEVLSSASFYSCFTCYCSPLALGAFISLMITGAAWSFAQQTFAVPADADSLLQQPGWISVARILQFTLVASCFCWTLTTVVSVAGSLRFFVRWYVYAAVASSLYGIISWLLLLGTGLDLGGAYIADTVRLKASFNEGGPFGLYAISAAVLLAAQWRLGCIPRSTARMCLVVLLTAFIMAQSKAATLSIVLVCIAALLISKQRLSSRQIAALVGLFVLVIVSAGYTGAERVLSLVSDSRDELVLHSNRFAGDNNIMMGRIAGSVIVPRMILANPILGVGIGNYSLLRDTSEYNPSLPAVDAWDLHGLGLYGLCAEIGIPALLMFIAFFAKPVLVARQGGSPAPVIALCCFPVVTLIFGVQPTFLYPWVLLALGIAISRVTYLAPSRPREASLVRREAVTTGVSSTTNPSGQHGQVKSVHRPLGET